MSETRTEVVRMFQLKGGRRYELPEFSRVLDSYATEVETESWKRALDWVSETLELGVLTEGDATAQKDELAKRLAAVVDRLTRLEQRSDKLAKLEAAGVDNWEGYGHALRDEDDADDEDEDEDGGW